VALCNSKGTTQAIERRTRKADHCPEAARVDVNMVLLNVTVMDAYDRVVTSLELSNFEVFDEQGRTATGKTGGLKAAIGAKSSVTRGRFGHGRT